MSSQTSKDTTPYNLIVLLLGLFAVVLFISGVSFAIPPAQDLLSKTIQEGSIRSIERSDSKGTLGQVTRGKTPDLVTIKLRHRSQAGNDISYILNEDNTTGTQASLVFGRLGIGIVGIILSFITAFHLRKIIRKSARPNK